MSTCNKIPFEPDLQVKWEKKKEKTGYNRNEHTERERDEEGKKVFWK